LEATTILIFDLAIADEVWLIDYSKVFLTEKTNIILPFLGEYIMSSLVFVKYIRLPTNLLNLVGSTVDPLSSLLNIKLVITGVGEVLQFDNLNLFKTALAYFHCDINIPLS